MTAPVDKAGVAGAEPAAFGHRVAGRVGLFVIASEHRSGADQDLTVLGDQDLCPRNYPAHTVGIRLAVRLQRGEAGKLGRAPDLLYVDPERAEEFEGIGTERRAAGIDPACAAQTQLVADRAVDEDFAKEEAEPRKRRRLLTVTFEYFGPLGKAAEELEDPALERRRIRRPDPQLGQHVLPDARWGQRDRRAELAQVALHRLGALRAVAGEADQHCQHQRK